MPGSALFDDGHVISRHCGYCGGIYYPISRTTKEKITTMVADGVVGITEDGHHGCGCGRGWGRGCGCG